MTTLSHPVIGLAGPIGVGKSTAGAYLADLHGMRVVPFAGAIKQAAQAIFDLDDEWLQDSHKNTVHPYWGITPRQMFVGIGEELKRAFGTDLWIKRWALTVRSAACPVLVDDVRATAGGEHEANHIRALGGKMIHITGPQRREAPQGINYGTTEDPLPVREGDAVVINTGTLGDFYTALAVAVGGACRA